MPIAWAAAITAGSSYVTGKQQQRSADRSLRFQREMAQKAHQYEVADLRAAGLNPILSGTGGPGAKASGGAIAQVPDYAASAKQALRLGQEIKLLSQQARGQELKADIDEPAAMVGRLAVEAAKKIEKNVRSFKAIMPTGQQAIPLADEMPTNQRTPYKGFSLKRTSKKERLLAKARRSRSRRR